MRRTIGLALTAVMGLAAVACRAEPPVGAIVRNPFYDAAVATEREATNVWRPKSDGAAAAATMTVAPLNRAEPAPFVSVADVKPLAAERAPALQFDDAVVLATAESVEAPAWNASLKLLSAAIDAQLEVTRLTSNPFRLGEASALRRATAMSEGPNPLR